MSDIVEPITVAEVRTFIGLADEDTADDALLTMFITLARQRLEPYLPFYLASQTVRVPINAGDTVIKGPVGRGWSVTDRDGHDITASCGLRMIAADWVLTSPRDGWMTYLSGSVCPDSVRLALFTMVRNLCTDRAQDPLTDAVRAMCSAYIEVNV